MAMRILKYAKMFRKMRLICIFLHCQAKIQAGKPAGQYKLEVNQTALLTDYVFEKTKSAVIER